MKKIKIYLDTSKIAQNIPLIQQLEQEGFLNEKGILEYDDEKEEEVKRIHEIYEKLSK